MGAWIEISPITEEVIYYAVAPRVGAWIEISRGRVRSATLWVAPRVGAWIEIVDDGWKSGRKESLPVWERGLKFGTF